MHFYKYCLVVIVLVVIIITIIIVNNIIIRVIVLQGPVLIYQLVAPRKQMTLFEVLGNVHERN